MLGERNFAWLWWGQLFSVAGDRLTYLALAGLFLQHSLANPGISFAALLAVLANMVVAPVLLLAPFTGAWLDRQNLKQVMVIADTARVFIVLAMPWAYYATGSTGAVFALVFLLFTANVIFGPAKSALLPEIVPPGRLVAANSLLTFAGVAATAVGALAGGYIVDFWGWAPAMQINAATYMISVITLAMIRYNAAAHHAHLPRITVRVYATEVIRGWALLRRNSSVAVAALAVTALWFAGGILHVAGNEHIQVAAANPGVWRIGALLVALGIGTGFGTWWMNTHMRAERARPLGIALVLAALALLPFAFSSSFAVFLLSALVLGLCAAPIMVISETVMQECTPLAERARVFSARDVLLRATLLVSVAGAAWGTARIGTSPVLTLCALVLAVVGAVILRKTAIPGLPAAAPPNDAVDSMTQLTQ